MIARAVLHSAQGLEGIGHKDDKVERDFGIKYRQIPVLIRVVVLNQIVNKA
jgi:hypothetical protein